MRRNNKSTPVKKNLSSTQVLKTLQVLMEDNYTMAELIQKLNENEKDSIFNNSVVSKYINTCRYCGINILKIHNKYFVTSLPFGINLSNSEYNLIKFLQNCAKESISVNANKNFENFITKLSKFSNREISRIEENTIDLTCSIFEQAVKNENNIRLMLKNKAILECIPLNILESNSKLYFHVFCNDKEKNILIDRVSGLEVLKEKFQTIKREGTVIFKLTGDLAKNYSLRENEKIIKNDLPESLTVINYNENNPVLLSRLLKYGDLCEAETKSVRSNMKNIINEALANYGE